MKIHLAKDIKFMLTVISSIGIGLAVFYLIYTIQTPHSHTQETLLYNSNSQSWFDYKVQLMPNPIYSLRTMERDKTYISIFTDTIDISYTYQFNGSEPSHINGSYVIRLVMEGYSGHDKDFVSLWTKAYPPVITHDFTEDDSGYSIQEHFQIPLNHYLSFINQLDDAFPLASNRRLKVSCDLMMTAETQHGTIENTHTNTLIIPLTPNFYAISGNLIDEKASPITSMEEIVIPVSTGKIIFLCLLICLFILGLISSIFFIVPIAVNEKEKIIQAIFKKYGSRLIALHMQMESIMVDKPIVYVCTFEGLVRMSDELVQPIMYKEQPSKVDIDRFYVNHDDTLYCYAFDLDPLLSQEQQHLLTMVHDNRVNG
ncbi:hypothetical protein HZI73_01450 [Vallitalea pronyensis]|uniref:DUF5305 domain-containing protein n=1 Tax=Vallitalea pronyensis TaxID=1348613 RepID=A0A8J8SEY6_9FIRM|nr:DUF5305 family protein [Vallitalea pronyensis]QUI21040.1 hypothetical protein HZI73_01450 [Vallitalea pronyensis]